MGFLKNIKDKVNNKIEEKKKDMEEDKAFRDRIRAVEKEAAMEEREKQVVETAKFKEQVKAKKQRQYIKDGGLLGAVSKGMGNLSKNVDKMERRKAKASKSKVKQQPEETIMDRLNDFKLEY